MPPPSAYTHAFNLGLHGKFHTLRFAFLFQLVPAETWWYMYISPSQNEVMLSIFVCIFFHFIYHEFIFRSQWANLPRSFQCCTVSLSGKRPSSVDSGLGQHYLGCFQLSVTNYPATSVLIKVGINLREFTFFYGFYEWVLAVQSYCSWKMIKKRIIL